MKRLLSALLCTAILCTTFFVPSVGVYASGAYTDYVPGEKPANLINSQTGSGSSSTMLQYFTQTNTAVAKVSWNSWTQIRVTSQVAYDGTTKVGKAGYYMPGALIHDTIMPDGSVDNDKYYVVNFYAKAAEGLDGTVRDTKVNVGVTNYRYESKLHTTKEYGDAGMDVSTDWKEFKGTIYVEPVHPTYASQRTAQVSLGLSAQALAGTGAIISDGLGGQPGKVYLAEEVAYDIKNELTSNSSVLTPKNSATFKAEVVNQVGNPGYLEQNFTWLALDKDTRTTEIDGIIITPSDDTTTATVTVAEDVEAGSYDIVAYSETYDMAKGYTVNVDVPSKYVDYVPGEKPANLIDSKSASSSSMLQYFTQTKETVVKVSWDNWTHIKATSQVAYDGVTKIGRAGYYMPGAWVHSMIMPADTIENEKSYVINYYAKAATGLDGTVRDTYTNAGITNYRNEYKLLTTKEYGSQGMPVSSDWKEFKGTIYVEPIHEVYADQRAGELSLGLSAEALAGTSVIISDGLNGEPGKVYFAEETVYDITNTLVSGNPTLEYGEELTLKAEVVNQLGIPGYLSQSFTWAALDKDTRTQKISGITVTPSEDTTTATVTVDSTVPAGEYVVAAYSEDYEIAKGFVVTVEETDISADYVAGSKPQNLMPNNADANNFTGRWLATFLTIAPAHDGGISGIMRYPIEGSPQYWGDSSAYIVAGGELTDTVNNDTGIGNGIYNWKANTNYVISTDLKNSAESSVTSSKFGFQLYSKDSSGNLCRPGKILDVTSNTDWQTFKFVLHSDYAGDASTKLFFGYPNHSSMHNPQGTEIQHRLGSFYIAEEKPYAINVTGTDTTLKAGEGSLSFSAEILNQLEIPYEGSTDIEWYVMNEYRTKRVDGFTLTPSADGKSVTVSALAATAHGKYVVMAEDSSLGVAGFRKGVEILVTPFDVDMTEDGALVYVAPYGDDDNYGTKAEPLATFEAALSKIEELKARGIEVAEVIFRGGDYRVNNVEVNDLHSGSADKSIVFKAYNGEKVSFKGSVEIDMSKAYHVTDTALLNRMYPSVHDKVVVIDLTEQGITKDDMTALTGVDGIYALQSTGDYNTVYVDGVEQPIAQWPNGREYTTWTPQYEWYISDKLKGDLYPYKMGYTDGDNPDRWGEATQWWVSVFPDWDFTRWRVSPSGIDTSKNTIDYPERINYETQSQERKLTSTKSRRWKAYNLLEEIDLPGEFYIDRENMLLYFYPPYDTDGAKVEFSTVDTILSVNGARNLLFSDLHFTQNLATAVVIRDVVNVDFDGCSFTNIGYKGLVNTGSEKPITGGDYWQQSYMRNDASYNCDIRNCLFDNCGGISLQMIGGNADTLTPSGNIIENNIITRSNQRSMVDSSMLIAGVGNTVRNNNFAKSTQHAITLIGNDHLIDKNEIHNVLREVADAGAIYQGRNQMQRGTTISANLIHDIWPSDSRLTTGTVGIYMDDCHQGNTIKNNFLIGTKTGYNSHGAAAQKILNNIMVDTNKPWTFPGNPNSSTETIAAGGTNDWDQKDGVTGKVRSTMYEFDNNTDSMEEFLSNIYDLELYKSRYPDLAKWIETNDNPHSYTVFKGNISVDATAEDISDEALLCWDDRTFAQKSSNITDYTKDIFVDPDNLDYRVKSTSAAATANPDLLSDANFDMNAVGVQRDFELSNATAPFKLLYPAVNESVSNSVELYWEDALLANRYQITVATDAAFENKVVDEEIHHNIYSLSGLTPGTRYYWKVTAKNTSRDFRSSWESAVSTFYVTDIVLTNTALTASGNVHTFKLTVTNEGASAIDTTIYAAAYSADGRMHDVQSFAKTISTADTTSVSFDTKGEYDIDHVKIFTWKNGDVTPLRSVKVLKK